MDCGGGPVGERTECTSVEPGTMCLSLRFGSLHDNVAAELIDCSTRKESTHDNARMSAEWSCLDSNRHARRHDY